MIRRIFLVFAALVLAHCGEVPAPASREPVFHAQGNPERLSDWNLLKVSDGALTLNLRVTPYDLNSSLFTDYAHKLRTVWLPEGKAARYDEEATFDFPVGTVISKTFYYPADGDTLLKSEDITAIRLRDGFALEDVRLIETRLLVHREEGWIALPYVWNEEQTDAVLMRTGDAQNLTLTSEDGAQDFAYIVPNQNQCKGCHATNATSRELEPIGPKARHLNKVFPYAGGEQNQLVQWSNLGLIQDAPEPTEAPETANWSNDLAALDARARAYLDINCAHCHNRVGPADTSGLLLEHDAPRGPSLGLCKLPIAAGKGTGGRSFGIVPGHPEQSIFTYRMSSVDPSIMMPELGRSLAHEEGVKLIEKWIASMEGGCG